MRQCLTALADYPQGKELFRYRFADGPLAGHSFGNLFLAAAEKMTGSFTDAVAIASHMLDIHGRVEPVTRDSSKVWLRTGDGVLHEGEHRISSLDFSSSGRPDIWLEPAATVTDEAAGAILNADMIVIAQGNLYGSIAPVFAVEGVSAAILEAKQSGTKIVYVCNLVNKKGQTDKFTPYDYADEVERFAGGKILDFVLYNTDRPTAEVLAKYAADGDTPVEKKRLRRRKWDLVGANLLSSEIFETAVGDKIASSRSLIRHDPDLLAKSLMKIFYT